MALQTMAGVAKAGPIGISSSGSGKLQAGTASAPNSFGGTVVFSGGLGVADGGIVEAVSGAGLTASGTSGHIRIAAEVEAWHGSRPELWFPVARGSGERTHGGRLSEHWLCSRRLFRLADA